MSKEMNDNVKRWTVTRKLALVMDIIQGKTTVSKAGQTFDLSPSEIENWVDEAKRGMENALKAKSFEIKKLCEKHIKDLQDAYGKAMQGIRVSIEKLCRWFEVPRRTFYYSPTKAAPKANDTYVKPIKATIEDNPSFGYRTVAYLTGINKNTVQVVFQLMNWQVRKRPVVFRSLMQVL
ncbi:MAG: DUF1153 domain-containing protein [Limnobacter sp.]|uniref:DUF1153 domain-containing protein n=1 Tax=Limnobacter sp. TaxID=2003368 RepID=UPI00391D435B